MHRGRSLLSARKIAVRASSIAVVFAAGIVANAAGGLSLVQKSDAYAGNSARLDDQERVNFYGRERRYVVTAAVGFQACEPPR